MVAVLFVTAAVILLARGNSNSPIQIINPSSEGTTDELQGNATPPLSSPTMVPDLQVYINGAVQNPGVYPLQPGDRLADALEAAGGAVADADLTAVNLAQRVRDEGYYYIPKAGETPPPVAESPNLSSSHLSSDAPADSGPGDGLIDLNTATLEDLTTLPGIGDVRAQAIVAYREQNGPFLSVEQVMEVSGIGSTTYENIRDLVQVSSP